MFLSNSLIKNADVSDGDLRRALQKNGGTILQARMRDLMTKNPRSVGQDVLAFDAMKLMEEKGPVTALVVLEQGKCVGLIRMHDILQAGI
jgi:arabinose-5-phosphate isomerase